MAFGIPNQPLPMDTFARGFTGMDDFFKQLREHALKQQQMVDMAKYRGADLGLRQQAGARAAELQPLNTELLRARIEHLKNGSNGISITTDPDTGQPLIQIGGSKSNSQGATFMNPQTGEAFSKPTGAATTKLQNRIIGEEQLKPIISQIIATVPQFQSGWKQIGTGLEGVMNKWLGSNYEAPSTQQSGHAAMSKAAESLVSLFGLHANARNVDEVKNILEPGEGESSQRYAERVMKELQNFAQSSKLSQEQLRRGINITNPSSQDSLTSMPSDKEIEEEATYYKTTPENIRAGIKAGIKDEKGFRDFLEGLK